MMMVKSAVFEVYALDDNGFVCGNKKCPHLPEYHDKILRTYFIKRGTMVLDICIPGVQGAYAVYCRSCIDTLYHEVKPLLDTKLWAFK